jgi:hypothetical protein
MSRAQTDFSTMSRATKVVLFVSSLLGLFSGMVTGVPEGKALAARMFSLRTAAVDQELSRFSATEFQHADEAHARAAALLQIRALEQIRHLPRQYQLVPPEGELLVAYARLAMIEEAAGNSAGAQAAFQQARAWQNSLHPGHDVTDEQFRKFVRQRDAAIAELGE